MSAWQKRLARLASAVDDRLDALKRPPSAGLHIAAYRGYGTPHEVFIGGRVLAEAPSGPAAEDDPWWRNLLHAYRRIESDEVPGARVSIRFAGANRIAVADTEGYFRAWLAPAQPIAERLWHEADLRVVTAGGADGPAHTARVMTPLPGARFGVISDLDDTVVRTEATNVVRMLRSVLLANARTRLPFDGVAAFYRALHAGETGAEMNPIFYLSSSPWNLYDMLAEFMDLNGVPEGPILLRDWGIGPEALLPTDHTSHKLAHIRHLLETYPLPFILIGDSGQQDPEIYRQVVTEYPARIHAIYIRNVTPQPLRQGKIRALAEEVQHAGSALILADDTLTAASHAAGHGWIAAAALAEVARDPEVRASQQAPQAAPEVIVEEGRVEEKRRV
jgi:phosphatidate phosphatase APP1